MNPGFLIALNSLIELIRECDDGGNVDGARDVIADVFPDSVDRRRSAYHDSNR